MENDDAIMTEIMNVRPRDTFPASGYCRVKGCGILYSRSEGGRKGMCSVHYKGIKKIIDEKRTTWDEINRRFPMEVRDPLPMPEANISEVEFQNHIIHYLQDNNHGVWMLDPNRQRGVPDLLIITADGRVMLRELKVQGGRAEEGQNTLMEKLRKNGADVAVWRPEQWGDGTIEQQVLGESAYSIAATNEEKS